jgi:hypothetical protein
MRTPTYAGPSILAGFGRLWQTCFYAGSKTLAGRYLAADDADLVS